MNESSELNKRIQAEREPLAKKLFTDNAKRAEVNDTRSMAGPTDQPPVSLHPLEGKTWFRLAKVIYITLWIVGFGSLAAVALAEESIGMFAAGAIILAAVLFILKKGFYYIVLGRTTATEIPGKGFIDIDDLGVQFAAIKAAVINNGIKLLLKRSIIMSHENPLGPVRKTGLTLAIFR
jgi:hypothetical protein